MSVLAALFVIKFVPETKGRTLEAIQDIWEQRVGSGTAAAPARESVSPTTH
jgi:hypothetical protein